MTVERRPAGPVSGEEAPSSQAAGEDPSLTPPAGGPSPKQPSPPPAGDSTSQDDKARVERDLDSLLANAERERDEYLDLAKRTKADFENFRRRMAAEVSGAALSGKLEMASGVVPVLDDL